MKTMNKTNDKKQLPIIPDYGGATVADRIVFFLAKNYSEASIPREDIIEAVGGSETTIQVTLARLLSDKVLFSPCRTRFKLRNLNQHKHLASDGGYAITEMFRLRGPIDLPLHIAAGPAEDTGPTESTTNGTRHVPANDYGNQNGESEDPRKTLVKEFVQSIRDKLNRFESEFEAREG